MPAPAIRLPWELSIERRWVAESLVAAAGARVTPDTGPELALDGDRPRRRRSATSRGSRRAPGSATDEHGRFPGVRLVSRARRGAGRRARLPRSPRRSARRASRRRRRLARAAPRFFVALTHDIDTPWRWTRPGLRGAASRLRHAARELRVVRRGRARRRASRSRRVHRVRGTDPNWCFEQVAELESRRGFASTSYVLAAHRDPHDGARPEAYATRRPRLVRELSELGGEVGLHASYRSGDDEALLRAERHDLELLLGAPVRGMRFHYLRMRVHEVVGRLDRLGVDYDTSLGFCDRPGPRAGFSFPFRPWDHAAGRPAGFLELPLLLMDATLAEERYLGLSTAAARRGGRRRARPARRDRRRCCRSCGTTTASTRVYGRGWGGVYEHLLDGIAARGGTAGTAAALCDWWRAERCAS